MRGIEQHYEDQLPAETEEMKECERLAQATEARIQKMKYEAMLQGKILHFNSKGGPKGIFLIEAAKHFEAPIIAAKKDLPVIKRGQLEPLQLLEKQSGQR